MKLRGRDSDNDDGSHQLARTDVTPLQYVAFSLFPGTRPRYFGPPPSQQLSYFPPIPPTAMRKLATQVPEIVSRLQRANIGASAPPTWLAPVISHPPPVQPSRSSVARTTRVPGPKGSSHSTEVPLYNDLFPRRWDATAEGGTRTHKSKHFRAPRPRPQAIVYEEDRIRRQFFRDFPYEALRPTSLVEGQQVGADDVVDGKEWTKLSQRGIYPTVEE